MASSSSPAPFQFPREYYFPAFFTRQTNLNTLHAQLVKWSSLVLSYCQHHRIFKLSLSPTSSTATAATTTTTTTASTTTTSSTTTVDTEELFHNRKLNRRLALADVREVIDFMRRDGRAEYVGGGGGGDRDEARGAAAPAGAGGRDLVWVYWRTPEEWAGLIEAWVDETAQKGTVLTLYELTEGEATRGTGKSVAPVRCVRARPLLLRACLLAGRNAVGERKESWFADLSHRRTQNSTASTKISYRKR